MRKEPYIGVCSREHPFAGRRVPPEELFRQRLILREEGSGTRAILENGLQQMGCSVSAFAACAYISSFKVIKELVRQGAGISFLYQAVVQNETELAQFSCPPLTGSHELNVVFLKNTNAAAAAKKFLGCG